MTAIIAVLPGIPYAEASRKEGEMGARFFDGTMTVNRIVQEFPDARRVFERLFINVPAEGCTCLDEVAWRHGLEVEELLDALEAATKSCCCPTGGPSARDDSMAATR
jgi:hypothetical protein